MRLSLAVLFGFLAGFVAGCGPVDEGPACGPDTCGGCCTALDECLSGTAVNACGSGGAECSVCEANEFCQQGACERYENGEYDIVFPDKPDASINYDAGVFMPDGGVVVLPEDDGGLLDVSYAAQVKPILDAKCSSCHTYTYNNMISNGLIVPGSIEESPIYTRTASGDMPRTGTPLTATQQRLLRDWILNGAPNN